MEIDPADFRVVCKTCGQTAYYDEHGKIAVPCGCCRQCEGPGWYSWSPCVPCAGTGRRLPGSEEITAVEPKPLTKK